LTVFRITLDVQFSRSNRLARRPSLSRRRHNSDSINISHLLADLQGLFLFRPHFFFDIAFRVAISQRRELIYHNSGAFVNALFRKIKDLIFQYFQTSFPGRIGPYQLMSIV
jgi:hypothetical protein